MKRVVGRKMVMDQTDDYSSQKITPVDPDIIFKANPSAPVNVPFRFKWCSDQIDKLKNEGSVTYTFLDIGTYDGFLPFIISTKSYTTVERIETDAVEACKPCFEAANTLAHAIAQKGLKLTVHNCRFEDYETNKIYSVIAAFEVLEHTRDPLFCVEKIYDLLEIGGHILLTVPEQSGAFGLSDKNKFHYWSSSAQSLIGVLFSDDRKWKIKQLFEESGLIHAMIQKRTYQGH
jgi:2-polyprenyl-3-methyl-5-hydroxy-6-metoxy-1,4-benzoquinol methylase